MKLTKSALSGCIVIDSDDCWRLTGGRDGSIKQHETNATSFSAVRAFIANHCSPTLAPQLHQQAGDDTATISLRYKVPAEPARKVPTRLSPKLRP
jgi:hypothetical protein